MYTEKMQAHLNKFNDNADLVIEDRQQFIRDQVINTGGKGLVLGLSGGLDSAVVAGLAARALGPQNVIGLWMGAASNDIHHQHAKLAAEKFGFKLIELDFTESIDKLHGKLLYNMTVQFAHVKTINPLVHGNLKPRMRKMAEYWVAQYLGNWRVANTCNWSETAVGYETKWGDGVGDFSVLGDLVKAEVRIIAKAIGVPQEIIDKAPSADLWEGHTDEDELGFTYEALDTFIRTGEVSDFSVARAIQEKYAQSAHKRNPMPLVEEPQTEHLE